MDRCEKRMGRAEKLVVLLADEGVRWKETVFSMVMCSFLVLVYLILEHSQVFTDKH
jgi:hypothetical protein